MSLSDLPEQLGTQLLPVLLQYRVGDVRDVGVDPLQVAQDVQVNGARIHRLLQTLMKSVDVRLPEIPLHLAQAGLMSQYLLCQVLIPADKSRDADVKNLQHHLMELYDLPQPLFRKGDPGGA